MTQVNEELIRKTLTTSDFFAGGQLNPEQQTRFLKYVKDFSVLIKQVRVERCTQPRVQLDKMFVGEVITRAVEEGDENTTYTGPKFNKVSIEVQALISTWAQTTKALQANIEQDRLEESLIEIYMKRIATDLEDLFYNGDSSNVGTTPRDLLLKRLDGISKIAEGAHVIDAGGSPITKGLWTAARRAMPKQFVSDPGLRWIVSKGAEDDWRDVVSDRPTVGGDAALAGTQIAPLGTPWIVVPVMPDTTPLEVADATPAQIVGNRFDPFEIHLGVNDKLSINPDGGGAVVVTLPEGVFTAVEIAHLIDSAGGLSGIASVTREGQVVLTSLTTGAASSIVTGAIAHDAYATLGLGVAGTVNGVNANGGGDVDEGTEILLCNPKNLIWAVLDGTRIYAEFKKDKDRVETVVYNQVDVKVENVDAIVKIKNVRKRDLF